MWGHPANVKFFPDFTQTPESKLQIPLELSFYPGIDGESASGASRNNQILLLLLFIIFINIIIYNHDIIYHI